MNETHTAEKTKRELTQQEHTCKRCGISKPANQIYAGGNCWSCNQPDVFKKRPALGSASVDSTRAITRGDRPRDEGLRIIFRRILRENGMRADGTITPGAWRLIKQAIASYNES